MLQQRHAKIEAERDQLYSKFEASIYSVQQKTGVRNLLLEKKLSALGGVLEHKEAQLAEVMAASNLDPASLAQLNTVSADLPALPCAKLVYSSVYAVIHAYIISFVHLLMYPLGCIHCSNLVSCPLDCLLS